METGFTKADNRNLPGVDMLMICNFFASNSDFCDAQFRNVKTSVICWSVGLVLLLWGATSIVGVTVTRFSHKPSYLTITESDEVTIKFPSMGICPEVEFPDYRIDELLENLNIPSNMNETYVRSVIRQLAAFYAPDVPYTMRDLNILEDLLEYNKLNISTATRRLTASCEEALIKCCWKGEMKNCSTLFRMELTAFGYCCVFNGRSLSREIQEHGIHKAEAPPTIYTAFTNPIAGLMIAVNNSRPLNDLDLTYKWIALVEAQQFIEIGFNGTPISPNTEHWIGHSSRTVYIDDDTRSLSQNLRRCRLSTQKLKYFPNYDKKECLVECEVARTIRSCQCVRITHPRPPHIRYCTSMDLACVKAARVPYDTDQCDCPATCDTEVDTFVLQTFPLMEGNYTNDHFYHDMDFSKVSIVRAFVVHRDTMRYVRRSYFTAFDLFSQLGGIFNVFFGCSILTLLELLHLTWYAFRDHICRSKENCPKKLPPLPPIKKKKAENKVTKKIPDKGQVVKIKRW